MFYLLLHQELGIWGHGYGWQSPQCAFQPVKTIIGCLTYYNVYINNYDFKWGWWYGLGEKSELCKHF